MTHMREMMIVVLGRACELSAHHLTSVLGTLGVHEKGDNETVKTYDMISVSVSCQLKEVQTHPELRRKSG